MRKFLFSALLCFLGVPFAFAADPVCSKISSAGNNGASATLSVTLGTHATGDLILVHGTKRTTTETINTPPSGYVLLRAGNGVAHAVYGKLATSSSEAAPSITWSGTSPGVIGADVIRSTNGFPTLTVAADIVAASQAANQGTITNTEYRSVTATANNQCIALFTAKATTSALTNPATGISTTATYTAGYFTAYNGANNGLVGASQMKNLVTAAATGLLAETITGNADSATSQGISLALLMNATGACSSTPAITSVDADNRVYSTQTAVSIVGTGFCTPQTTGTVTLRQNGNSKTLTVTSWNDTTIVVTISGVGGGIANGLMFGDIDLRVTNSGANFDDHPIVVTPPEVPWGTPSVGAVAVGTAGLTPAAPPSWPVGSTTFIFTSIRNATSTIPTPAGWSVTFKSEEEAIALFCRVKQSGDTIPTVTWTGSAGRRAVAFAVTGGPGSCNNDQLVGAYSLLPRDLVVNNFPYNGLEVPADGSLVMILASKDKTAATDGATVNAEPNFTEMFESGQSGSGLFFVGEYWIQTTATDIVAGSLDFTGATEDDQSNALTIALSPKSEDCVNLADGLAPRTWDGYGSPSRIIGEPLDLQLDSQIYLRNAIGCDVSQIIVNPDGSLNVDSSCQSVDIDFSRNGLYLGTVNTLTFTGLPPVWAGIPLPNMFFAQNLAISPFDLDNYFIPGEAPILDYTWKQLSSPSSVDLTNGTGVDALVLPVDDDTGIAVGDWLQVGSVYSRVKYVDQTNNEIGLWYPISFADNATVSKMTVGTCSIPGLSINGTTHVVSGTPTTNGTYSLCLFRLTDTVGLTADSP